ncbi:MAG: GNAT family N-acetyltransferase [Ramlibacter sp.]
MGFADPVKLEGRYARLEPLALAHEAEAIEAVRDGELWKLWYTAIPTPERMRAEIERRLGLREKRSMLPFAVRDAQGRFAGMTTYMNIDGPNRRLEIGSTWYRGSAQRTPLNTECKRMLLAHAFERPDCIAVEFRTHWFNFQSRAAIARLGARQDGVLRHHALRRDGTVRDTVMYSLAAGEWPEVKAHLAHQLTRPREA